MKLHRILVAALVATVVSLALSACEDDPTSSQAEHFEAEGLELKDSGIKVIRYFQGTIDASVSSAIEIEMGLSPLYSLDFLDGDGKSMGTPEDSDHYLGWVIDDTAVVTVEQHDGENWSFHLLGKKPGDTTIEIRIYHGDHYDFHTIDLPIHVSAPEMPEKIRLVEESLGTELATSVHEGEGAATGSLGVNANATSGHIEVEFLDANGGTVSPPDGVEFHLHIASDNEAVVAVVEPAEDEPYAFQITGVAAGSASIEIHVAAELDSEEHDHDHSKLGRTTADDHTDEIEVHFEPIPVAVQ